VGASLVSLYYKTSPPIAQFIDANPAVKPVVRAALMPAVAMSKVALSTTLAQKIAILAGIALVSLALVVCLRRWAFKRG
jgi:trimethylamine:corrinoid methyltransferase-like protein